MLDTFIEAFLLFFEKTVQFGGGFNGMVLGIALTIGWIPVGIALLFRVADRREGGRG